MYYNYEERDQLLGKLIEISHNIDNDLATKLAGQVDNPIESNKLEETILKLNLHSDPKKIEQQTNVSGDLLNDVFERVITSLVSGRGTVQHNEIIGKWLRKSLGHDFQTIELATTWFIENSILGNKSSAKNYSLDELFTGLHSLLQMIKYLGNYLMVSEVASSKADDIYFNVLTS